MLEAVTKVLMLAFVMVPVLILVIVPCLIEARRHREMKKSTSREAANDDYY